MRELGAGDRGLSGPGTGFEGVVREAVDAGAEGFIVGAPADAEVSGAGPAFMVRGIRLGGGGYGCGGAEGEEGRIGGDVGDEVVKDGGGVGEDAGGGKGLERVEGRG